MNRALRVAALVPLLAFASCDGSGDQEPPEVARARERAARSACVASEMLRRSADDVESLEALAAPDDGNPAAALTRKAGEAALSFGRAYHQHAQLRAAGYAHLDSAYRYSARSADSLRHIRTAEQLAPRPAEVETIEANVTAAYDRNFLALLRDPDHPCNWDLEIE
jgi:hypothetical protein